MPFSLDKEQELQDFMRASIAEGNTPEQAAMLWSASQQSAPAPLGAPPPPSDLDLAPPPAPFAAPPLATASFAGTGATGTWTPPPVEPTSGTETEMGAGGIPSDKPKMEIPRTTAPTMGTTTEEQTSTSYTYHDPSRLKALEASENATLKANDELNKASIELAKNEQERAKAESLFIAEENTVEQARRNREQADIDNRLATLDSLADDYGKMEVDSNRFWTRLDTGDRVLAGISLALGAFGQALGPAGSKNMALEVIDKAIDRDIDEQKHNIDKNGRQLTQARGMYADFRDKTGDDREARSLSRQAAWQTISAKFTALGASAKTDQARLQADTMAKEAQMKVDAERVKRTDAAITKVKQSVTAPVKRAEYKNIEAVLGNDSTKLLENSYGAAEASRELNDLVQQTNWKDVGAASGRVDQLGRTMGLDFSNTDDIKVKLDLIGKEFLRSFSGMGVTDKELVRFFETMPSLVENPEVGKRKAATMFERYSTKYTKDRDRILTPLIQSGDINSDHATARFPPMMQQKKDKHGFK